MTRRGAEQPAEISIDVAWSLRSTWGAERLLARAAEHAALAEGFRRGVLSLAVVGKRAMATLHERFSNDPTPTDVLTFDLDTNRRRKSIEGEIVVCADVARQRAAGVVRERRVSPPRRAAAVQRAAVAELCLYVVHGVLHLAGHDDHTERGFARMHAREDELLAELGLGRVFSAPGRR